MFLSLRRWFFESLLVLMPPCSGMKAVRGQQASTAAATASGVANRAEGPAHVPGAFDYYLLDLPWGAVFCSSIKDVGPDCRPQPGFVVHGLWPQNDNGTWPEFCTAAPAGAAAQANLDLTPDANLLRHEWAKHGTCSGLDEAGYFAAERRARAEIEVPTAMLTATSNTTFTPLFLLNMFYLANPNLPAGSLSLSCREGKLLAVEACFSKSLKPVPCAGLRSCEENVVRLERVR